MGLFNNNTEPMFLNSAESLPLQIEALKKLEPTLNEEGKEKIRKDIKLLEYGLTGENAVTFELQNSHMPIYVLRDLYFEIDGYTAQIDFLVFTRKQCFIIECKNLYGNVTVDSNANFIREMIFGNKSIKEGIYSPITQNERHLQVLKKLKMNQVGVLGKLYLKNNFETYYTPIVVIANSKTILNTKYATKDIKLKIIRADQLIEYIKKQYASSKLSPNSDKSTLQWVESFLSKSKNNPTDYLKVYEQYRLQDKPLEKESNLLDTEWLTEELKKFRLNTAKAENVVAYKVFNNQQLSDLIKRNPTSLEEIKEVKGFGEVKVSKYGDEILALFKKANQQNKSE